MPRTNGLYGYVKSNEFRSLKMFVGFVISFQLIALAVLAWPLLFLDPGNWPFSDPLDYLGKYGLIIFMIELVLFLAQFLAVTSIIRSSAHFQYCYEFDEGRLHRIVHNLAMLAGISKPKIALLRGDARNAFACGTGPSDAVIVVTTGLLETLNDDELSAVIAHEIVHIRNGDIVLMACANILVSNIRFFEKLNIFKVKNKGCIAMLLLLPPILIFVMLQRAIGSLGRSIGNWSRQSISASRELIADAEAVRLTQNPGALISALRKIEGKSRVMLANDIIESMMIDGPSEGSNATHPTIEQRINALIKLTGPVEVTAWAGKDTRPLEHVLKHRHSGFGRKGVPNATGYQTVAPQDEWKPGSFLPDDGSWGKLAYRKDSRIGLAIAVFLFSGAGTFPASFGWLIVPLFVVSGTYLVAQLYDFVKNHK